MENRAYALAAGLFTLLLGAGVIVAAMWFSGETYDREYYVLESKYAVTGLNVQSPVRLRGVEVGKVEGISFDPENPKLILIRIHVRQGTPITPNIIAQLGTQGVTGLAYVMLEERNPKSEPIDASTREKSRIPVARSFLDAVAGSGNDLLTEINQVAQKVNKLLDEKNQAELLRMINAVQALSERATVLAQKIEPAAQGIAADTRETLAQASAMLKNMSALTEQLAQRVDVLERVAKSAEQMGVASQSIAGSAQSVAGSAQTVSGVMLNESLPRMNELLDELARTSRNLDRLLSDLNEQPHGLVFGRNPARPGPGEAGFTDTGRSGGK